MTEPLRLFTLPGEYAVQRLPREAALPAALWQQEGLVSVTRAGDELSVVAPAAFHLPGARREAGWTTLGVQGPLDFNQVGVMARLSQSLAAAGISLLALSTFDTDYLLVKQQDWKQARTVLRRAGCEVDGLPPLGAASAWTQVRRRERAIYEADWIVSRLRRAEYGVLATCAEGQPFTVARNFVYDAERHCIYLHGARKGRTFSLAQPGARANFNVSWMGRLLPGKAAMDMSVEYEGVVIFGRLSLVDDPQEAKAALQQLVDKYFPHLQPERDYIPIREVDLKVTAVLRLDIESWSGKRKPVPDEVPGAFYFRDKV